MSSAVAEPKAKKYGPFRLMHGLHIESHPDGRKHPDGRPIDTYYRQGDEFYSETDLATLNAEKMTPKFVLVTSSITTDPSQLNPLPGESPAKFGERMKALAEQATKLANQIKTGDSVAPTMKTLEAMSFKELQNWVAEEEMELPATVKTKEEALKVIKGHLESISKGL